MNVLTLGKMRIAAGGNHFAFIDGKGSVWTTGHNDKGQLGSGDQNKHDQIREVWNSGEVFLSSKCVPLRELEPSSLAVIDFSMLDECQGMCGL